MEKDFVTYEQAKELFDMGLRVPIAIRGYVRQYGEMILTDNVYDGHYTLEAPLKSQTFRWFRDKYGLIGWVEGKRVYRWCIESPIPNDGQLNFSPFKIYEEAENACIDKLIEIAKQQDK